MYDLGWKGWEDLPAADFVKQLRKWDDDFMRDHLGQPWSLSFAPTIEQGELTVDQVKFYAQQHYLGIDTLVERIAKGIVENARNRLVRDLAARHLSEEAGHSTLWEDFCVHALGMDRVRDLWEAKPFDGFSATGMKEVRHELVKQYMSGDSEADPALRYSLIPFAERHLPRRNAILAKAFRKVYGFPDRSLTFFDLHTYIDIYHERIGLYIIGLYATTKKKEDMVIKLLETRRLAHERENQAMWEHMGPTR
jgi:pyrroloquinoline quinone (PQQ) biosynthesis protein C